MIERHPDPHYVLGYSQREMERLELQGRIFEEATRRLFIESGIEPGMHVLDVGCGAGDVAFIVAELVGSTGRVTGVDVSPGAVSTATARAERKGITHVEFVHGDAHGVHIDTQFDAVVGRFILMHQADPVLFLARCSARVRPGGSIAFLESHLEASVAGVHSHPHSRVFDRLWKLQLAAIEAVGAHTDMGLRLPETFRAAGLPDPVARASATLEGHAESDLFRYTAESVRSMLPVFERNRIARLTEADVDAFENELRAEVTGSGGVLMSPVVVGAYARVPHDA